MLASAGTLLRRLPPRYLRASLTLPLAHFRASFSVPERSFALEQLHALAQAIGISRIWWDVDGTEQTVSDTSLAAIATALGYPANGEAAIAASLAKLATERLQPPAMIVTDAGAETPLPASLGTATLSSGDGPREVPFAQWTLPPIDEPGYYALNINGHDLTLAVAPLSCPAVTDLSQDKLWGPAIQIPALRSAIPQPFGNFGDLAEAVRLFAARGADALAINPVHALFAGNGHGFSPYSPSSRLYLNSAMGDPALLGLPALPPGDPRLGDILIDWENALPVRLAQLRALFATLDPETRAQVARDNAAHGAHYGDGLRRQAIYDALDVKYRPLGASGWHDWPEQFHDPDAPAVAAFAREHAEEVEFHLFTQWLARESLAKVQAEAQAAGMAVGLLADLAVGVHTGGADSWSMRANMLEGLTIGAPPDPLGPQGQNWMLTGFSPQGLKRSGYAPWIETIRAALQTAGGLRIDHAFGLARLWVVPQGQPSSAGAYLSYPFEDLIRLVALEAHRAGALIVAEDLGTMPHGFAEAITARGMLGMRVLWFERAQDEGFIGAGDYAQNAVAMTGTHDTATVAGWWTGRDIEWAQDLGRLPAADPDTDGDAAQHSRRRDWDRGRLWSSLTHDQTPRPAADAPAPVVEAALRHIGHTPCALAIAPLEDLLALVEQPNLPGTVTEHPNWRRRLNAPLSDLLGEAGNAARVEALDRARKE